MALKFADLKKKKGKFGDLLDAVQRETSKAGFEQDIRIWNLEPDSAGNGFATIRFLDAPPGEDVPYVRVYSHGFKGPSGKWYIENSLTTIGQDDPVSEMNSAEWAKGDEDSKNNVRKRARRTNFYSNILVVNDPKHPENNDKVFLFRYGKKIFEKIKDAMNPAFEDENPMNPFDMWEGANFKLKMRKVDGYANYDKSEFESTSSIADDDKEIEAIWQKCYSLQEFLAPKNFKSYGVLKAKMNSVMGLTSGPSQQTEDNAHTENVYISNSVKKENDVPWDTGSSSADDDDLKFFENLANA